MLWLKLGRAVLPTRIGHIAHLFIHHCAYVSIVVLHHHADLLVHVPLVFFLLLVLIVLLQAHFDVIVQFLALLVRQFIKVEL